MAEPNRRPRRGNVSIETQEMLEQQYQANPYPNRFDYLFISRNANIDMHRLKNWFNNRRRSDSKSGKLCKRCRCFKAPMNPLNHSDEHGPIRACQEYWNAIAETVKLANNNQPQVNSSPQLQTAPSASGNYAQFTPANPLSTYVDTAALIRFMNAWQRSRNESPPFYPNQQFLLQQQHQNTIPMWMNQQQYNPIQTANAYLPSAWINQQPTNLAPANRNYQREQFTLNGAQASLPFNQPINGSVFTGIAVKLDE